MAFSMAIKLVLVALVVTVPVQASEEKGRVNPIRKITNLLEGMVKKVEAEGEKEKEIFEKFMCYCKGSDVSLQTAIDAAKTKVPQVSASIDESEAQKAQLAEDLKTHASDRTAAKAAMSSATALREKEAAAYATTKSEGDANVAAMKKALVAIEKGAAASFLQSAGKQTLIDIVQKDEKIADADREKVASFLSGTEDEDDSDSSQGSGEIVGILKQMQETMEKDLADAEAAEETAITTYDELMAAKNKEIAAATAAIEKKTVRVGELAVEIVQMKGDLKDTQEQLVEDQKMFAELDKMCADIQLEYAERVKMRQAELLALQDCIKMLTSDDALELFKKTLPAAGSSFMQLTVSAKTMRDRALEIIRNAQSGKHHPRVDFVALALSGKKVGFDGVIKMIDDMAATNKKEQEDDDSKKEYCLKEIDITEDKKKGLELKVSDLETSASEADEAIKALIAEIDGLSDGIKALDKSVAEATEIRKEESEDYTVFMSSNAAAKELIAFAKNRLQKFYNPKLYKAAPKRVLTDDERATLAAGGTLAPTAPPGGISGTGITVLAQVSMHTHLAQPEGFGTYSKKSEESGGVMAMMDMIAKDLDEEMSDAKHSEKQTQEDYEKMLQDSAEKRALDVKALTDKEATKASVENDLADMTDAKTTATKEVQATSLYLSQIHGECDFLLEYFDARKEARTAEYDDLLKSKAALSGADLALLQTHHQLRKSA